MFTPLHRLFGQFLFILIYALMPQLLQAQTFGGNPPSVKWKKVNIPAARIIFPQGIDTTAFKVANIINRINGAVKPTLGYRQKQINIVLQNQTLVSNGYVGLAPFRSEFYLTPEQNSLDLGSLPFAEQLAVHEFRHVQQFNNFDVGLTRAVHLIFGESGQAFANGLSIPNWLDEGDAVYDETLVTRQGRGRLPYFFNDYRVLWAAGKQYSFMKLRNGSYVDLVPDHYPLGYMLVAYGRDNYGSDFWGKAGHDAAAFKSLFYPLQNAVRQYSGQRYSQFTTAALNYFKQQLITPEQQQFDANLKHLHFKADHIYPVYADDSTLLYKKLSYKKRLVFVMNRNGKEHSIRLSDMTIDDYFDYQKGKIIYMSYRPDVRWGYRDYNELAIIDVATGGQRRITRKTKYFAPAFSATGDTIVTVQIGPSGKSFLHLLNAVNGHLIQAVPNPDQLIYTYPKFYNSHTLIAAVRRPSGEMAVALIHIPSGKTDYLTESSFTPISFPVLQKDTLYFTAVASASDRLYALAVQSRKLYRLTNDSIQASLGNYQPAVSKGKIAWVNPTVAGYQLHQVNKNRLHLQEVARLMPLSNFGVRNLQQDSAAHIIDSNFAAQPLSERKYPRFTHPFNFHSIFPYFDDPNYTLSLEGQNILNTFTTELAFTYNRNEQYKKIDFNAAYGAWFPYLFGGVSYTFDRRGFATRLNQNIYWNEKAVQAGLQLPFNFTAGTHYTHLSLQSSINYAGTDVQAAYQQYLPKSYTYADNTVSFSTYVQQPKQNIYPHWAQTLTLNYKGSVSSLDARQFLATGNFYFPGLAANHSIVINAAWQQRSHRNDIYTNDFPFSRGYTAVNLYEMGKAGINYHFPLAYPDAGLANLIYISRIRANLFFDATRGAFDTYTVPNVKANFRSVGAEIYFDTSWFNQAGVTFGLRYSYLLDDDLFGSYGRNRFSLIVPLTNF